jgi:uncharacterized membrane protein
MHALRASGLGLFLAGFVLLAVAVARGEVGFYLVAIVPVLASGSALFGLGLLALVAGFFLVFFGSLGAPEVAREAPIAGFGGARGSTAAPPSDRTANGGGLILIGPVPFFFGSWRGNAPVPYWVAVLLGALLLLGLFGLAVLFAR